MITDCYLKMNKPRYFCPNKCGRSYLAVTNLNRHVKYECGDTRRFSCPYCSKTFKQKTSMQGHAANIHKCIVK